MAIMVDVLKNLLCHHHHFTFTWMFHVLPQPPVPFFIISKKYVSITTFLMWDTNIDRTGLGYDSPLPTSYRRISVTESTRVVILSACATVRDGYVLCVCLEGWSFRCGSHSRTFPSLLSPPEPAWLWERVKCLSLIQLLEAQWPARESEKSYHPLHPPFKTRLMVREGRFRFSANIRAAGVAVHIG